MTLHHNDTNQGSNDDSPVTVIVTRKEKEKEGIMIIMN
jgi:hypothetical protein